MEKDMQKVLAKAEVLIEALPYIQKYNRRIIIVKYGGSAMANEELQRNVIKDVTLLKLVGFKPIIVHGGGKEISKWVGKVGKESQFINGLRVTDEETMEIAEMVLSKVNKRLVTMVEELGVKAVGVSGKDGALLRVDKKYSDGQDIGYVGEIKEVSRSYKEARMALDVGKIFFEEKDVIAYSQLGIGRLIYQLPIPLCKMFIKEIFDGKSPDDFDEEILTTINKFFENSLNVSETSRQLYIHRNTLVYRLDKLQKSTGLDLRVFEDAITFRIALMVVKYMKYMESLDY